MYKSFLTAVFSLIRLEGVTKMKALCEQMIIPNHSLKNIVRSFKVLQGMFFWRKHAVVEDGLTFKWSLMSSWQKPC